MNLKQIQKALSGRNPEPKAGTVITKITFMHGDYGSSPTFTADSDVETQFYNAVLFAEDQIKKSPAVTSVYIQVYEQGFYKQTVLTAEWNKEISDAGWALNIDNL